MRKSESTKRSASSEFSRRYENGMRHFEQRQYSDAIVELEAAYQIEQKSRLLYNLARAHFELGHAEDALGLYQRFLNLESNPPAEIKRRAEDEIAKSREMIRVSEQLRASEEERRRKGEYRPIAPESPIIDGATNSDHRGLEGPTPLYRKWWFWTAIAGGVAVVGGITGGVLGYRATHPSIPDRQYQPVF